MNRLAQVGISMDDVTDRLLAEGVRLFEDAFTKLLKAVETQSKEAGAALACIRGGGPRDADVTADAAGRDQPGRRGTRQRRRARRRPRSVGRGQRLDPAATVSARPVPGHDLRLGARHAGELRLRGDQARGRDAGRHGLRHRDRRRAGPHAGRQRGSVDRPRAGALHRHPRRAAFRAGRQRLRRPGVPTPHVLHAPAPVRDRLRRLHRGPGRHRHGPRDGDDLAAPPGAAPAGDAADSRRTNVAGPDRVGPAGDARLRPAPGQCRGPGDPALRGERRRGPRDHPGPSHHVAPRSAAQGS